MSHKTFGVIALGVGMFLFSVSTSVISNLIFGGIPYGDLARFLHEQIALPLLTLFASGMIFAYGVYEIKRDRGPDQGSKEES